MSWLLLVCSSMQYYKCNQFATKWIETGFISTTLKFTHQKPYIPQSASRSKFTKSLHVIFSLDTKGMIFINVIKIAAARIIAN